jgi:hypothetical protein
MRVEVAADGVETFALHTRSLTHPIPSRIDVTHFGQVFMKNDHSQSHP